MTRHIGWGWGSTAHLFVGALSHSSKWRAVLAESEDQPHLVEAIDQVVRRLGGCTKSWRFDRMTTVCHPATGRITATFGPVAKFYGVTIKICPSRHGNRKGVVEKGNHSLAQRWWRTLPDDLTVVGAQASLDEFCARVGDTRRRSLDQTRTTVAALPRPTLLARASPDPGGRERDPRHLAQHPPRARPDAPGHPRHADGHLAQRSATTPGHKAILAALELPEPPRFFDFTVPDAR